MADVYKKTVQEFIQENKVHLRALRARLNAQVGTKIQRPYADDESLCYDMLDDCLEVWLDE